MDCSMVPGLRMLSGKLRDLELTIDFLVTQHMIPLNAKTRLPLRLLKMYPCPSVSSIE